MHATVQYETIYYTYKNLITLGNTLYHLHLTTQRKYGVVCCGGTSLSLSGTAWNSLAFLSFTVWNSNIEATFPHL